MRVRSVNSISAFCGAGHVLDCVTMLYDFPRIVEAEEIHSHVLIVSGLGLQGM